MPKIKETPEVSEATGRLIRAVGRRVGRDGDPAGLAELQGLQDQLTAAWSDAVAGLRELGFSDAAIAAELGITRQAVYQKWPRAPRRHDVTADGHLVP